jgi:hypothetical protein
VSDGARPDARAPGMMPTMIEIESARTFMATHARLLDRRRLDLLLDGGPADRVLAALLAYRNPDGGFGWGLEPDLRGPASQVFHALHAFEVLERTTAAGAPAPAVATALCDWLATVTLPDGGLPFAVAGADTAGTAPWFAQADPAASSLHATAAVASAAHQLAVHEPAVAAHPWLARATAYALERIAAREALDDSAYELLYVLQLLDALAAREDAPERERATALLDRVVSADVPASGVLPVKGGVEGEVKRPLDFSPWPGRPLRERFPAQAIAGHLDALEAGQREDGGWTIDFRSASPAGAIEWRGVRTLEAIELLGRNGRL